MCGEKTCGIHQGFGSLGPVMLLEHFLCEELKIPTPLGLTGPLQFVANTNEGSLDIDLMKHKVIASHAELGIDETFGQAMVVELIHMEKEWAQVTRWVSTETWKGLLTYPNAEVFRDDEGSQCDIPTPSGDRYSGRPPLTAQQKVACWLHDRGFPNCRNWPTALTAHSELKEADQLAIKWGWLDETGGHPNHAQPVKPLVQTRNDQEKKPVKQWRTLKKMIQDNILRRKEWRQWNKKHTGKISDYCQSNGLEYLETQKAIRNADAYVQRYTIEGFKVDP